MNRFQYLYKTCVACPSQWEGLLKDGRYIYIRYRWGILGVGFGSTPEEAVDNYDFHICPLTVGESYDGTMTTSEMLGYIDRFVKEPK